MHVLPFPKLVRGLLDQEMHSAIFAFVNGDDIIPRASLGGLRELGRRLRVLAMISRAGCVALVRFGLVYLSSDLYCRPCFYFFCQPQT